MKRNMPSCTLPPLIARKNQIAGADNGQAQWNQFNIITSTADRTADLGAALV
jgi:hypothetical protein